MRKRKQDLFDLDPAAGLRWDEVEALNALVSRSEDPAARLWSVVDHDSVLVAALARSAFRGADAAGSGRRLAETIGLDLRQLEEVELLVAERELLTAAATRMSLGREEAVLELAAHIGIRQRADALYLLAAATTTEPTTRDALDELYGLITSAMAHPELTGAVTADLVETKKEAAVQALQRMPQASARRLLDDAPRRYLLVHSPQVIARHARMLDPMPVRDEVRIHADPDLDKGEWTVDVITLDKPGVLAAITKAFSTCGIPIVEAWISTWSNDVAVDVFRVSAPRTVDFGAVRDAAMGLLAGAETNGGPAAIVGPMDIDNVASPWHTIVEVRAQDRKGLLHRVAEAFSRAGFQIQHATVRTEDEVAVDTFLVTNSAGHKLTPTEENVLRLAFDGKPLRRWTTRRMRKSQPATTR